MTLQVSEGFVDQGGGRLFYEEAGTGAAVVLIHGGLWDRRMWDDQFETFAERFRTIRYDVRGFGRSDLPTGPYSNMDDLRAVLGGLGIERAGLVGLSMGGGIALEFALTRPAMTRSLVLAAPGVRGHDFTGKDLLAAWERSEEALEAGDRHRALEIELGFWAHLRTDPDIDRRIRDIAFANIQQIDADDSLSRRLDPPALGSLGEISCPTLVVLGAEDAADINRIGEMIVKGVPGARKVVLEGADHLPNMRRPDEFNRAVLEFLSEHAA